MGDDSPDWRQAINLAFQELNNLAVDISGQSIGDLEIDITAQSLGDVDILFNGQSTGVESGTEFAASQGNVGAETNTVTVQDDNPTGGTIYTNSSGSPVVVEEVSAIPVDDTIADYATRIEIDTDGDGSDEYVTGVGAGLGRVSLDPGVLVQDTGDVSVSVLQETGSSQNFEGQVSFRIP